MYIVSAPDPDVHCICCGGLLAAGRAERESIQDRAAAANAGAGSQAGPAPKGAESGRVPSLRSAFL